MLNWTDEPIPALTVIVPNIGVFDHVTSVTRGWVPSAIVGDAVRVTIPLVDVDVLMLEARNESISRGYWPHTQWSEPQPYNNGD